MAVPKSATDELPQTGDNKLPLLVVLLVLLVAGTSLIAASVRSKRKALR
ncbi:MAG: LPXTG cell wall anchor domain-containing protein [Coriobacteriales bacterium]|nr:LPXTG cell wall anchor domain-containing protein [Coriobacteriales bacterium]